MTRYSLELQSKTMSQLPLCHGPMCDKRRSERKEIVSLSVHSLVKSKRRPVFRRRHEQSTVQAIFTLTLFAKQRHDGTRKRTRDCFCTGQISSEVVCPRLLCPAQHTVTIQWSSCTLSSDPGPQLLARSNVCCHSLARRYRPTCRSCKVCMNRSVLMEGLSAARVREHCF